MKRRYWTEAELQTLRQKFPTMKTADLALELGRYLTCVSHKAHKLGLSKTPEYLATPASGRTDGKRGLGTRFTQGQAPWNKGRKGCHAGGRSKATQFQPGRPAHESLNYVAIGTYRVNHDGYLEQKTTDDRSLATWRRWVAVHRLVWEATHGPVPTGHAVVFLQGKRTTELEHITIDAIELVTRAELMKRNTLHRLPSEVVDLCRLRGRLRTKIKRMERANDTEQNAKRP